jgi:hypothetical protein
MSYERTAAEEKEDGLSDGQLSLADRIARWTTGRNRLDTRIQGLSLHRWEAPPEPESYMLAPSVCLIGQGRKRLFLGEEAYVYDAHRFLITSVDLLVVAQIIETSADKPYLGLTMELDLHVIAQLMLNDDKPPARPSNDGLGVAVSAVSPSLLDAFRRLLDLLEHPQDIAALAPLVQQEIFYACSSASRGRAYGKWPRSGTMGSKSHGRSTD